VGFVRRAGPTRLRTHDPPGHRDRSQDDRATIELGDYRLVQAQRLLAGGEHCSGTRCWRLTFKATRLIPTSLPALIGAGGELFFTVDVDRGAAKFTGHGE
jgi:hypothetical protein